MRSNFLSAFLLPFSIYIIAYFSEKVKSFSVPFRGEPVASGKSGLFFSTPSLIFYIYYNIVLKKSQSFLLVSVGRTRRAVDIFVDFVYLEVGFCVMRG